MRGEKEGGGGLRKHDLKYRSWRGRVEDCGEVGEAEFFVAPTCFAVRFSQQLPVALRYRRDLSC